MVAIGDVPTIRRRLASMLYDGLLLLGVIAVGMIGPHLLIGWLGGAVVSGVWLWLHLFVLIGLYFVWYWIHGGQTLAMQTWKIKLDGANGQPPSMVALACRYTFAWPSVLIFGTGILWALLDPDRQFLHDRLAGTRLRLTTGVPPTTAVMLQQAEK